MTVSATLRHALKLAPALAAAALLAAPGSASASTTSGDAFGICRDKVRATFGEEVQAHYANMGRIEVDAFDRSVTDWERVRSFERM